MPTSLLALAAGAFGIGTTEFIIMGLLTQVSQDLHISIPVAGTLISGYAIGVAVGAPLLTLGTRSWPRKQLLLALMLIFIAGNVAAVFAPTYGWLMAARVLTSLTHGTFFGVGAVVATGLVPPEKKASAIALMFSGLTLATLLGVPAGAWIGQHFGWRMAFAAVAVIGVVALAILAVFVPKDVTAQQPGSLAEELAVLKLPQVWLGLGITVFGFAGVFALYTYIEPLLTQVTQMSNQWVAITLLIFGAGLAIGNYAGGKLADKGVMRALAITLVAVGFEALWTAGDGGVKGVGAGSLAPTSGAKAPVEISESLLLSGAGSSNAIAPLDQPAKARPAAKPTAMPAERPTRPAFVHAFVKFIFLLSLPGSVRPNRELNRFPSAARAPGWPRFGSCCRSATQGRRRCAVVHTGRPQHPGQRL